MQHDLPLRIAASHKIETRPSANHGRNWRRRAAVGGVMSGRQAGRKYADHAGVDIGETEIGKCHWAVSSWWLIVLCFVTWWYCESREQGQSTSLRVSYLIRSDFLHLRECGL